MDHTTAYIAETLCPICCIDSGAKEPGVSYFDKRGRQLSDSGRRRVKAGE
jgi:hypothetical protein